MLGMDSDEATRMRAFHGSLASDKDAAGTAPVGVDGKSRESGLWAAVISCIRPDSADC